MTNVLDFRETEIPEGESDESPPTVMPEGTTSFDPEFPGSTPEAPFGFKPDGTPYKRRPNGAGKGPSSPTPKTARIVSSDSQARAAAALLATMNKMIAISLHVGGLPMTAESLNNANGQFEEMAMEALRHDPALCRKILSAGTSSGKAGLIMAYGTLGMNAFGPALTEFKARKELRNNDES